MDKKNKLINACPLCGVEGREVPCLPLNNKRVCINSLCRVGSFFIRNTGKIKVFP